MFNLSVYAPNEQLFLAILTFDEAQFEDALKRGADPNGRHPGGLSMLDAAVSRAPKPGSTVLNRKERALNARFIQRLLALGADVRSVGPKSVHTALHIAASQGVEPGSIKPILDAGPDLDARDRDGKRPIDTAIEYGSIEVAGALVNAGADTSGVDERWLTAIRTRAGKSRSR